KIAQPEARSFETVRLAPLYDAVTTVVFPGLEHDRMALKINGKDARLRRADILKTAATAWLAASAANRMIDETIAGLAGGLDSVALPEVAGIDAAVGAKADQMLTLCRERLVGFA